ncbi:MAG: HAMP domain-containing protein [Planctomycetales bacterium]|nr:HAMP domain-containing protein [Planctomycetales bacterium]
MHKFFQLIVTSFRSLVRRLVVGWSLERKSLLFFGTALVVPIGLAFWFIVAVVANHLVLEATRLEARDYAKKVLAWRHVEVHYDSDSDSSSTTPQLMALLRDDLIDDPNYRHQYVMLDQETQHIDLKNSALPSAEERLMLEGLQAEFREYIQQRLAAESSQREREATVDAGDGQIATAEPPPGMLNPLSPDSVESAIIDNPLAPTDASSTARRPLFREAGPVFSDETDISGEIHKAPPGGWYVYYHAVAFESRCLSCHSKFEASNAEPIPFRVVKVLTPYGRKQVASTWTLTVMLSIGMVTVAVTLLVVHWVLRRIVLTPLTHLKTVSDEISRGNTDLRANIDTGDEFNELSDAFNRMLRHMTESQEKLKGLNRELDVRVDQLAQANLNLFEANRLKNDFMANMSHELRTPLNSIIGFSDVLGDIPTLSEKQRRYAANIQRSGKLLLEMINDILDLAKVEAGKMTVAPTSFKLQTLVSAQCDMLRSLVDERNMELHVVLEEDMEEVFQDQPKFQQILTNLLSNAIKFTPDGGLITVSAGSASEQFFFVTVEDTGVGIPESDFEIIFEKFRQSNEVLRDGGLTREFAGTGLGLSIVKELCKLLGGEVRLSSQLGTGSQFQIILPKLYTQAMQPDLEHARELGT